MTTVTSIFNTSFSFHANAISPSLQRGPFIQPSFQQFQLLNLLKYLDLLSMSPGHFTQDFQRRSSVKNQGINHHPTKDNRPMVDEDYCGCFMLVLVVLIFFPTSVNC